MTSRRRERRIEQAIKRADQSGEINIVSLIDIFAILVFYLLVNALVVEVIPRYQNLTLPNSSARSQPQKSINIAVSTSEIRVNDLLVMSVADALSSRQPSLPALEATLLPLVSQDEKPETAQEVSIGPRNEINIVADRGTPYLLLKKILATCTQAHFVRISLAVEPAPDSTPSGGTDA